jgi:hypothetical protein
VKAAVPEGSFAVGSALTQDARLQLAAQAELTLDFAHGARVRLLGEAGAAVHSDAQDGLLVEKGVASVDLAPSAPTQASGFALTAPCGRLSLVRSGRYAVRVLPDGTCVGFVASGLLSVVRAGPENRPEDKALSLLAGERFELSPGAPLARRPGGISTLAEAEQEARAVPLRGHLQADDARLDALLARRIDEARTLLEEERVLVRRHRAALDSQPHEAMALQRQLSLHASRLSAALATLRVALEQRLAARLDSPPAGEVDALAHEARRILARQLSP